MKEISAHQQQDPPRQVDNSANHNKSKNGATSALSVFTIVYAHCLALQVAKDMKMYSLASFHPQLLITAPLAISIIGAHVYPSSNVTLLCLATSGLLELCVHGSQSNHVIVEIALTLSVLLTAPSAFSAGARDTFTHLQRRQEWSSRLSFSIRVMFGVLYGSAGFSKLNDGFFDPSQSCSVQMAAALLGPWMPSSKEVLYFFPISAVAFEFGFPAILWFVLVYCRHNKSGIASSSGAAASVSNAGHGLLRGLLVSGAIFHATIALPPPPLSVYPFTMLMAPFYVMGLIPDEVGIVASAFVKVSSSLHVLTLEVLVVAVAVGKAIQMAAASDRFEYPPYFAWELGILWSLVVFGILAGIGLFAPRSYLSGPPSSSSTADTPQKKKTMTWKPLRLIGCLFPSFVLLAVATMPYLGIRNHPALAMFSNLDIGGGFSNHLLIQDSKQPMTRIRLPEWLLPHEYSSDSAILILDTNFSSLKLLQVNLTPLLPPDARHHIDRVGACPDFYLAPPSWKAPPTEPFVQGFVVPTVEIRRRLSANTRDGFLRYQWVVDGKPAGPTFVYRQHLGKVIRDDDDDNVSSLDKPLPYFRGALHRFRPLDLRRAVCRH
jgi:hypothetical protein